MKLATVVINRHFFGTLLNVTQSTSDEVYFCVLLIKKASPLVNDAFKC